MTEVEKQILLELSKTQLYGFKSEHEFVRTNAHRAEHEPDYKLDSRKSKFVFELLHKYRKPLADLHAQHCQNKGCRLKQLARESQFALF